MRSSSGLGIWLLTVSVVGSFAPKSRRVSVRSHCVITCGSFYSLVLFVGILSMNDNWSNAQITFVSCSTHGDIATISPCLPLNVWPRPVYRLYLSESQSFYLGDTRKRTCLPQQDLGPPLSIFINFASLHFLDFASIYDEPCVYSQQSLNRLKRICLMVNDGVDTRLDMTSDSNAMTPWPNFSITYDCFSLPVNNRFLQTWQELPPLGVELHHRVSKYQSIGISVIP